MFGNDDEDNIGRDVEEEERKRVVINKAAEEDDDDNSDSPNHLCISQLQVRLKPCY